MADNDIFDNLINLASQLPDCDAKDKIIAIAKPLKTKIEAEQKIDKIINLYANIDCEKINIKINRRCLNCSNVLINHPESKSYPDTCINFTCECENDGQVLVKCDICDNFAVGVYKFYQNVWRYNRCVDECDGNHYGDDGFENSDFIYANINELNCDKNNFIEHCNKCKKNMCLQCYNLYGCAEHGKSYYEDFSNEDLDERLKLAEELSNIEPKYAGRK